MKETNDLIIAAKKISEAVNNFPPDLHLSSSAKPQVMIVGGFVRDTLCGSNPKDADVEVFGVDSDKLVEVLQELFGRENVNEVGKSFGVIKVALPDGLELDVSIPRIDSRGAGAGHKDIEVKGDPSLSIIEAQRRRDFTINALSMDVLNGVIIDSFGGMEDLQEGVLRLVDEKTFKDDPLRVMRGVQFVARFGLTVETKTFSFMKEMVANGALDNLPADRIRGEVEKLLTKSEKPSIGLELMRDLGILERHFPELNNMIGCEQDPFFHPEGDVWTHTNLVVDAAAALFEKRFPCPSDMTKEEFSKIKFSVMLGALLHDVGKLAVTKRGDDGKIHSFDHETAGVEPAKAFLKRLNVSEEVLDIVLRIVRLHSLPGDQGELFFAGKMSEEQYKKATKRFLDRLQLDQNRSFPWLAFMVVCEADYLGCAPKNNKPSFRQLAEITRIISELKKPLGPVIQGQDILGAWREIKGEDRPGGPWVGEIAKIISEEGHHDPAEAMTRVKEIIKNM